MGTGAVSRRQTPAGSRPPPLRLLLLLAACALSLQPAARAFAPNPFLGQGIAPEGTVRVYLTVLVERILTVDQRNYGFDSVVYYYMSWRDPRAKQAIAASSKLQNDPEYNGGGGCVRFCDNAYDEQYGRFAGPNGTSSRLCCDGVWLPTFAFRNALGLPEDRTEPLYAIVVAPDGQTVTWRQTVHASFFTPMDFHAFPFDSQDLVIELSTTQATPDKIVMVPSATSHKLFVHGPGDDLSAWRVQGVRIVVDPPLIGSELIKASSAVHPDDPSPQSAVNATKAQLDNSIVPKAWFCLTRIHVRVSRLWIYFLWTAILPVCFLVWVAHVTICMGPQRLNDRVSVLITLMLALVALQWVIAADLPDSSYLLPTSKLILLSYACMGVLVVVSVLVNRICNFKGWRRNQLRQQAALGRLTELKAQLDAGMLAMPPNTSAKALMDYAGSMADARSAAAAAAAAAATAAASAKDVAPAAGDCLGGVDAPGLGGSGGVGNQSRLRQQQQQQQELHHHQQQQQQQQQSPQRAGAPGSPFGGVLGLVGAGGGACDGTRGGHGPGSGGRLPGHNGDACGTDVDEPVACLLVRQLSSQPRKPQNPLRRWWAFFCVLLMDEEVSALIADKVDRVFYAITFVSFNVAALLLLMLPHYGL